MQTICHEPPCILTEAQEVIYIQIEKPYFSGGGGLSHYLPSLPTVTSFHCSLQLFREVERRLLLVCILLARSDSGTYHTVITEVIIKASRCFNTTEPCLIKSDAKLITENHYRHTYTGTQCADIIVFFG